MCNVVTLATPIPELITTVMATSEGKLSNEMVKLSLGLFHLSAGKEISGRGLCWLAQKNDSCTANPLWLSRGKNGGNPQILITALLTTLEL